MFRFSLLSNSKYLMIYFQSKQTENVSLTKKQIGLRPYLKYLAVPF